jgi:hypothetical protein
MGAIHTAAGPIRHLLLGAVLCGPALGESAFAADRPASAAHQQQLPAAPASSLSPAQLKKINNLAADDGIRQAVPAVIMSRLGLMQNVITQLGVIDKVSGDVHAYATLRDGGILLTFVDYSKTKLAYTYRLDSKFKVAASVAMDKSVASDIADPEAGAKAELAYWAQVADQL